MLCEKRNSQRLFPYCWYLWSWRLHRKSGDTCNQFFNGLHYDLFSAKQLKSIIWVFPINFPLGEFLDVSLSEIPFSNNWNKIIKQLLHFHYRQLPSDANNNRTTSNNSLLLNWNLTNHSREFCTNQKPISLIIIQLSAHRSVVFNQRTKRRPSINANFHSFTCPARDRPPPAPQARTHSQFHRHDWPSCLRLPSSSHHGRIATRHHHDMIIYECLSQILS